jgi:aminoglycoside phosphotransferase (APT) family kinase protein
VRVDPAEIDAIASELGQPVTDVRVLAGGFSHETSLVELDADRVVARLGGTDPGIEAAVMDAARAHVPVPAVLRVRAAGDGLPRPLMILEFVDGTPLSQVLAGDAGDAGDQASMTDLGAAVGQAFGGIAAVKFNRPGFFTSQDLALAYVPPWSAQLTGMAVKCMDSTPDGRLDPDTKRAWSELCAAHAPALASVDQQARLVHADANPKNVLVTRAGGGWRVDAVLDWEFSFAGCPYADYANMTRFAGSYPGGFTDGFRAGFAARLADALAGELDADWVYLGRVMDMFALSDLVTRPVGHPVADEAAGEIRRWIADGIPA